MEITVASRPVFASTLPAGSPVQPVLERALPAGRGEQGGESLKSEAPAIRRNHSVIRFGVTRLRRLRPDLSAMAIFFRGSMSCGHIP